MVDRLPPPIGFHENYQIPITYDLNWPPWAFEALECTVSVGCFTRLEDGPGPHGTLERMLGKDVSGAIRREHMIGSALAFLTLRSYLRDMQG